MPRGTRSINYNAAPDRAPGRQGRARRGGTAHQLLVKQIATALDPLPTATLRELVTAMQAVSAEPPPDELAMLLAGGRTFDVGERAALRIHSLVAAFAARQQLLKDALSAAEVARLLGTSRQTPLDRLHAGSLLGLRDGGVWRFPPWQFDPDGPDRVVVGLPAVLAALHTAPFAKARWLMRSHPQLDGRSPIEALHAGEQARVIPLAARVQAQ